ncbi:MAG: hypothetical protein EAZ90_01570 [Oscillatoriales cyanobacterium]|nr:MAG: hypothetical protein EAZ90_01570 [Oscillatoriales cyanobacterium]
MLFVDINHKKFRNSVKKLAKKRNYYLLTCLDFRWYILDNGSGESNFNFATIPIIKLYFQKTSESSG